VKVSVSLSIMTKRHTGGMEIKVHYMKMSGSHSSHMERNPSTQRAHSWVGSMANLDTWQRETSLYLRWT